MDGDGKRRQRHRRCHDGQSDKRDRLGIETEIGPYRLITDGSELPVVAFTLAPEVRNYTVFDVSARLRETGWLVPAYTFPENRTDLSVLRVVVRAGLTTDMADAFLADLRRATEKLESLQAPLPDRRPEEMASFRH